MNKKLILIPAFIGSLFISGCASPIASYLPFPLSLAAIGSRSCGSSCGDDGSYQYDDSAARASQEAVNQMDGWLLEQQVQQTTDAANQATIDASNAAAAAAAASASVGIGQ